jgi:DNA-directed RNA polymerase subunit RPC12/RpoP
MNYEILHTVLIALLVLAVIAIRPNWFLRVYVHKKNNPKHFGIETYKGMSVTGYTCHECGYKWYVKRKVRGKNDV